MPTFKDVSVRVLQLSHHTLIVTLNKLLGSTDVVADIKKGFVQNLYTPSKGLLTSMVLGKVSVPHPHVIKDLMQPDQNVADQAVWNPQHITKTYRLEPKL